MSSPSPSEARRGIDWDAPLRATPVLLVILVAVHLATGLWWWSEGRTSLFDALVMGRSRAFRVQVGGQHIVRLARGENWRLLSSVFLHADLGHLAMNGIAIGVLGRLLEPWVGALRFLGVFLLGGVAGSWLSWQAGAIQSDGASGGAYALLVAVLVLAWRVRGDLSEREARLLGPILGGLLALNLVISLAVPFIDAAGHVGGAAVGAVLGGVLPVPPRRPGPPGPQ